MRGRMPNGPASGFPRKKNGSMPPRVPNCFLIGMKGPIPGEMCSKQGTVPHPPFAIMARPEERLRLEPFPQADRKWDAMTCVGIPGYERKVNGPSGEHVSRDTGDLSDP